MPLRRKLLWTFTLLQIPAFLFITVPKFGFDKPGDFGLGYGHAILGLIAYSLIILTGLGFSAACKSIRFALIQLIPPAALALFVFTPPMKTNANDFKHLIGKSSTELSHELRFHHHVQHGWMNEKEFYSLRCTIIYLSNGIVTSVESTDDDYNLALPPQPAK